MASSVSRFEPSSKLSGGVARGQSLSTFIVNQVIEALFAKRLEPGEFLGTEAQLAAIYKSSKVPVREALGRLEALGVVDIKTGAGGGASIARGEPDRFAIALAVQFMLVRVTADDLFDARIAIECRAAELAAEQITEEELGELRALLEEIKRGHTGRLAVERILRFHSRIVDASRARTLMALMHALEHALLNVYLEASPDQAGAPGLRGYHNLTLILERLEARDPPGAFAAMRDHLLRHRERVASQLSGRVSADDAEIHAARG